MRFIDYSGYKTWGKCPWNWYEVYVNKRRKKWPERQRDDPLAIGTLVHAGLEKWQKEQIPSIPPEVAESIGPTKEAWALASALVLRYAQTYPSERWPLVLTEKPLRFPVIPPRHCECGGAEGCPTEHKGVEGVAKLDAYFYVPEQTTIESGLPGLTLELSQGWWGQEYKTKDQSFDIGKYMQSWKTNMQANFQLLALKSHIDNWASSMSDAELLALNFSQIETTVVQGILVNVLEKPKIYIPRRKCRECEQYSEFSAWSPAGSKMSKGKEISLYSCPFCKNIQSLAPVSTEERPQGECFRIIVQRTPEQLEQSLKEIKAVAYQMQYLAETGMDTTLQAPNREACYDWRKGECAYYKAHLQGEGFSTLDSSDYEETEDYLGLEEEAQV